MISRKQLEVKKSRIPGAGKGLFTKVPISRGTIIIQYKGKITTWEDAAHEDGRNYYIYYVNKNHVIDAKNHKQYWARYANDARGFKKFPGLNNNASYFSEADNKVFIKAIHNIPAGAEIFVSYGKKYWDVLESYR